MFLTNKKFVRVLSVVITHKEIKIHYTWRKIHRLLDKSFLQLISINLWKWLYLELFVIRIVRAKNAKMVPSARWSLWKSLFRTVNVYRDPDIPRRPVTNISWSADTSNRLAVSYCFLTYGRDVDYSKTVYIWHVGR